MKRRASILKKLRCAIAGLLAGAAFAASAFAQSEGLNRNATRIRAADGRPCLSFREETRPEVVMKNAFDHLVHVKNTCPQRIEVTICYRGAHESCRHLALTAYREGTAFLGSMLKQADFAFDYEEKDDN